jgi:hypothetical protein|nr:hypothetical protein [Kofleriaceae bacterium]
MTRAAVVVAIAAACGGGAVATPVGPGTTGSAAPLESAATAAPNPQVIAARAAWSAGDLDGARSQLAAAGDDPRAVALVARLDALAGRRDAFAADVARLRTAPAAAIAIDTAEVSTAAWSRDGAWLATLAADPDYRGSSITIWDVVAGRDVLTLPGTQMAEFGVSPTTHTAIAVVRAYTELDAYALPSGARLWSLPNPPNQRGVFGYAISRGAILANDDHGTYTVIDLDTGAPRHAYAKGPATSALQISDDGHTLLAEDALLDVPASGSQLTLLDKIPSAGSGSADQLADYTLAPDGQTYAYALASGAITVRSRDGATLAAIPAVATPFAITAAAASPALRYLPDGTLIAFANQHVRHLDRSGNRLAEFDLPAGLAPFAYGRWYGLGGAGELLAHRGDALEVVGVAGERAVTLSRFGGGTRAVGLAWTPDGKTLTALGMDKATASWTVATGTVATGAAARTDAKDGELAAIGDRVFVIAGRRAVRYVEIAGGGDIDGVSRAGGVLAAANDTPTLHLWNWDTAQGLGTIEAGGRIGPVAVQPGGGGLVALGLHRGGVELWDLRSRTRVATLAIAGSLSTLARDGRFDGSTAGLVWRAGAVDLPEPPAAASPDLATTLFATRAPAVAIAPTAPAVVAPRGCLPATDARMTVYDVALVDTTVTYCLRNNDDPYCFATDLGTGTTAPVSAPVEALVPEGYDFGDGATHYPSVAHAQTPGDMAICASATSCRVLHVGAIDDERSALSDDGTLYAVDTTQHAAKRHAVDIYDVASGKRSHHFAFSYPRADADDYGSLAFFGHALLAVSTPCAGPCGEGELYDLSGKDLGGLAMEATSYVAQPFHDGYFVMSSDVSGGFAIQSSLTGKVMVSDSRSFWAAAVTPTRIVRVIGVDYEGKGGGIVVYNAAGAVTEQLPLDRCTK